MTSKLRAAALLVLVGAALAGGRVLAGIPSSDTLHYSGTLEKANGQPLTGDHFIELKLWHEASGGAEPADCATKSEKYLLVSGHFSVPLPAACVDAIARYSDTFVELIVDGAPLGRAKLGAVPYAVESDHATKADSAKTAESAAGELKSALDKSDSRVTTLESATTPAGVLERFNAASAEGMPVQLGPITWQIQYDIGWALQHSAAAAACAASSPERDSSQHHIVLPKPSGSTCTQACASNGAPFAACRTSIAIGQITLTKAAAYTDPVATNYNYGCGDGQSYYDEVASPGFPAYYTAYCCCYQ
jgi:hypothetical protein